MIVVADCSPLNYLIQINCDYLLEALYGRVLVPESVMAELRHRRSLAVVLSWASRSHAGIEVCRVAASQDEAILDLGEGESDAIQLALERNADLLLIDERRGRIEARRRGLETTGTLGILMEAGQRGLVNAESVLLELASRTNFRITEKLRDDLIGRARTFPPPKP
ncbi:MAG: DUF3368 domain-containing protein [Candidatus Acidiferrales bacterium]